MLVQEIVEESPNLIKTYSDDGHYVVNTDGEKYAEATDPKWMVLQGVRRYTESEELIPAEENPEEEE